MLYLCRILLTRRLLISTILLLPIQAWSAEPTDSTSGLIMADGWELVLANCGACHSYALVTSQRGDEKFWRSTIRWMQKTQNLGQIPEPQESTLVSYLAEHYNESDWGRRPPLAGILLPATD